MNSSMLVMVNHLEMDAQMLCDTAFELSRGTAMNSKAATLYEAAYKIRMAANDLRRIAGKPATVLPEKAEDWMAYERR